MKHKMFLIVAALVLLVTSAFNMKAQVGFNELDPNILWVADSTIGRIDGFAIHPNGNVFAYRGNIIYEINGVDGKFIRQFTVPTESKDIESIDISKDGRYLATSYNDIIITDLSNLDFKKVGIGNLVTFSTDSKKIAYRARGQKPGTWGHDSSIVILDLNTGERQKIKTEEMIQKIAFSPDGRFFATGGSGQDVFGKFYTTLKLWDANTLNLIKELERFEDENYGIFKIQFSDDNKMVGFRIGWDKLYIFDSENQNLLKLYDQNYLNLNICGFSFIGSDYLTIQSEKTIIIKLSEDIVKEIFDFPVRGCFTDLNVARNVLYTGTGESIPYGSIIAWDLKKVLSNVNNQNEVQTIYVEYNKGFLSIKNLLLDSNTAELQIYDINGKLVHQLKSQTIASEMRVPLILTNGTYLIHLNDMKNKYSSKFLVTE